MAPPPPHGTGRAPRQGPLSGFAEAAGTRVLAAARDQLLEDLVRGHDRLESARAVLSFTTELVARSHDALARSIAILAPKARRVRSVPGREASIPAWRRGRAVRRRGCGLAAEDNRRAPDP